MKAHIISKARASDHLILTEITKESKAFWGYSEKQLLLWDEELTISEVYLNTAQVYLLEIESRVIAYYSFYFLNDKIAHLDNLFVLPEFMNLGLGKILMKDFESRVKGSGFKRITLEADPHAEAFYLAIGYFTIDRKASSVEGRFLPIMEKVKS